MPKVHFLNEIVTVEDVPKGATIFELAQKHEIQLFKGFFQSYHCAGKGRCMGAGCKVWVNEIDEGAVPPKKRKWYVPFGRKLTGTQRMACQAVINGDCEIRTQPGAFVPEPNMEWEPDTRKWAWHDRLVVKKKKKKKPAPKPKPTPAAKAAPEPAAATPTPTPTPTPAGKPRTRATPSETDSGWDD